MISCTKYMFCPITLVMTKTQDVISLFDVPPKVVNHTKTDFTPKSSSVLRTEHGIPVTEGISNFVAKVSLAFETRFETC